MNTQPSASISAAVQQEEAKAPVATIDQRVVANAFVEWAEGSATLPEGVSDIQQASAKMASLREVHALIAPLLRVDTSGAVGLPSVVEDLDGLSVSEVASIVRHATTIIRSKHGL